MIKVALIGSGRMGRLHASNAAANPRLELAWVADAFADRALELASQHGARAGTVTDVIADPEVRGVVVATSTDALLATGTACLRAGKAVFSEKPLSLTLRDLEESAELHDPALPPLFVAFNRRFDPHMAALQQRIARGEIGVLESLHIVNHDPALPATDFIPTSGGLFKDFTVHDFDTAFWMTAEPFAQVFAMAGCLVDPVIGELGDVDTAKLLLTTPSGRVCLISNSRRSGYGYDQRVEAFGSKGALCLDNLREDGVSRRAAAGSVAAPCLHAFPQRYAEAYRREMDHFADIIEGRAEPRTGVRNAIGAIRLAEAAALSAQTGRPVPILSEGLENV